MRRDDDWVEFQAERGHQHTHSKHTCGPVAHLRSTSDLARGFPLTSLRCRDAGLSYAGRFSAFR
jgi:hypothetical protein